MTYSALIYASFISFCSLLFADPPSEFHTGLATPQDIDLIRKHEQLADDYKRAKSNCEKYGKVTLVIPLSPDGNEARFICVSADDTRYKAQRTNDPKALPPTNLDSRLVGFVGQNISVAMDRLGGPQTEPIENDDLIYEWSRGTMHPMGTTLWNDQLTQICRIRLATDIGTRVVKSFTWTERRAGCGWYAEILDRDASSEDGHQTVTNAGKQQ